MTAFHYEAYKVKEDENEVTYHLCTDFFCSPNEFVRVVFSKPDLTILNYKGLKKLPDFRFSEKPLWWLRQKVAGDRTNPKSYYRHLA